MEQEDPRTETEPQDERESNEADPEPDSKNSKPPIDEDVAGSVNAAVPDTADEGPDDEQP